MRVPFREGKGREGCSTKSPSPNEVPGKGAEITSWGLSVWLGLRLNMVGREGVPQQAKIRTTSCGEPRMGGAGWAFNLGQVNRGQKCLTLGILGGAGMEGAFLLTEDPYERKGCGQNWGEGPRGVPLRK